MTHEHALDVDHHSASTRRPCQGRVACRPITAQRMHCCHLSGLSFTALWSAHAPQHAIGLGQLQMSMADAYAVVLKYMTSWVITHCGLSLEEYRCSWRSVTLTCCKVHGRAPSIT